VTYNTDRRKPLTKKQRAQFLLDHDSTCYWCHQPIINDDWDDEHIIAKELMPPGSDWNWMSNRAPIHRRPCHKEKTAQDIKAIAKSNRIRKKHGIDPITRKHKPKPIPQPKNFKWAKRPFNTKKEK
jgi:5-methylcytosine-specific restriction enzyme A